MLAKTFHLITASTFKILDFVWYLTPENRFPYSEPVQPLTMGVSMSPLFAEHRPTVSLAFESLPHLDYCLDSIVGNIQELKVQVLCTWRSLCLSACTFASVFILVYF